MKPGTDRIQKAIETARMVDGIIKSDTPIGEVFRQQVATYRREEERKMKEEAKLCHFDGEPVILSEEDRKARAAAYQKATSRMRTAALLGLAAGLSGPSMAIGPPRMLPSAPRPKGKRKKADVPKAVKKRRARNKAARKARKRGRR